MAKISFFGATGCVTGSRFLLEVDNHRLLVDCGLFRGPKEHRVRNWEQFPVPPKSIDRVLLTPLVDLGGTPLARVAFEFATAVSDDTTPPRIIASGASRRWAFVLALSLDR